MTVFIALKAGTLVASGEVGLALRSPSGKAQPPKRWPVVFSAEEPGVNLNLNLNLVAESEQGFFPGLHWFDVLWGDEVLTSIPFTIMLPEPTSPTASPAGITFT